MATRNPARKPVEVGNLSHYLQGFIHFQTVVGLGISEPSTEFCLPLLNRSPSHVQNHQPARLVGDLVTFLIV